MRRESCRTSVLARARARNDAGRGRGSAGAAGASGLVSRFGPVVAVVVTLLVAAWTIRQEFVFARQQAAARLETIAELRASQVRDWVDRQMSLAWYLDDSVALADLYTAWQDRGDAGAGQRLLQRMADFRAANDGDSVLILKADGEVLAREHPGEPTAGPELLDALRRAEDVGKAVNTTLYRRDEDAAIPYRMDIVIPLRKTVPPMRGAIAVRIDPRRSLFPKLAAWPVPSETAESVLWEKRGDRIVNISETRGQRDSVGRFSAPADTSNWPVARVLRGEAAQASPTLSRDYRGIDAMAVVRPVEGTPWWLASKIDTAEMYGPARRNARWTLAATALALLGIALAWRVLRQRQTIVNARLERMEQAKRLDSLGLIEGIAQSASDLIFAMDLGGRYVFVNRAASAALGWRAEDILRRTNAELFDADTAAVLDRHDAQAMASRHQLVFDESIPTGNGMLSLLCTKGPLLDAEGRVIGIFGVSRDVRDMQRAERALKASEAHYRSVVSVLSEAIMVCNANGELIDYNPAADRVLGHAKPQWLRNGMPSESGWMPLNPDETPMPRAQTPTGRVLAGGPAEHGVVLTSRSPTGEKRQFEVSAAPVLDGETGALISVVTSVVDITERRRLEADVRRHRDELETMVDERTKALQGVITDLKVAETGLTRANEALARSRDEAESATRAKSAFLANMSHEIRTPMNAIIGLTHLMTRDTRDTVQKERLGKVSDSARHLLQVINDILDLSKIEAGKLSLHESEFSPESVLSRAVEMVSPRMRDKGLEMILDPDHLPSRLRGDETRLSQILLNLLSNAVKFTEHGWVRLSADIMNEDSGRVQVRFLVQDTGPGIEAEKLPLLFNTFEQADSSSTRRHGGTGLGLALSRQLARAMGGDAGVISAPGAGSTFWFTAWLGLGAEAVEKPLLLGAKGLRALLVDDLPEALAVIGERLRVIGLDVDAVDGGAQALHKVEAMTAAGRPYDVLLVDWRMEPLDGIETLRRLRALLSDGMPPSILITAFDDPGIVQQAVSVGYDAVLLKPITTSSLHDTLADVLSRRVAGAVATEAGETAEVDGLVRLRHAGQRVLLAEDNPINREVAEELLRVTGLVVETAWNGARAVELATSRPYDLVLMDVQMPVMDGIEATRAIRHKLGRALPIIAMTANAFTEDRQMCLEAGMNDHVAKPVDPATMYSTLLRWLPLRNPPDNIEPPVSGAADAASGEPLLARLGAIEGFDVATGLRNVGGQMPALARILGRFVDAYAGGLPILLDASGDETEGVRAWRTACHSVRGALATLGADALVSDLQRLERDLAEQGSRAPFLDRARQIHLALVQLVGRIGSELDA